jgi:hypothetical protein
MALDTDPVHDLLVGKGSCRLQTLDAAGTLREKEMTDLAVGFPLLMLAVGEKNIAAMGGVDHDVLSAPVFSAAAPTIRHDAQQNRTQQKNYSLFQQNALLHPVSRGEPDMNRTD